MRQVARAAGPPRSSSTAERPARKRTPHVVLQVVAHAENLPRGQAPDAGRRPERTTDVVFGNQLPTKSPGHRRPSPARAGPSRPGAAGRRSSSRRRPRCRPREWLEGRGDIGKASPRLGPAEMVPQLVKGPFRVWHFRQDLRHDPPPSPDLGRLVGRMNPPISPAPRRSENSG